MTAASDRVAAVGGERTVPRPDPVARDYLLLALRIDTHLPGVVDGYFGPADLKAQVDLEEIPSLERLADDARTLRERVAAEVQEADRQRWLDRQLVALETLAGVHSGLELAFAEEAARCFDAAPVAQPPEAYAETRAELERLLPGEGDLRERLRAWNERFTIPADRLAPILDWLVERLRAATAVVYPMPEGESLRVGVVTGQPWSAYNWYDGGLRSRVDFNTDLPARAGAVIDTMSHETFPGHHLEHAWKEARLVDQAGRLESSVLLLNTPEAYVSEGLAELGRHFVLDEDEHVELLLGTYERAGITADADDARTQRGINAALRRIRGAGGDAALRLHAAGQPESAVRQFLEEQALQDPDRAAKTIEFITQPLFRTYIFSYAGGERLLSRWCDAAGEGARDRFFRLLTEQLTPSGIAAEVASETSASPPAREDQPGAPSAR